MSFLERSKWANSNPNNNNNPREPPQDQHKAHPSSTAPKINTNSLKTYATNIPTPSSSSSSSSSALPGPKITTTTTTFHIPHQGSLTDAEFHFLITRLRGKQITQHAWDTAASQIQNMAFGEEIAHRQTVAANPDRDSNMLAAMQKTIVINRDMQAAIAKRNKEAHEAKGKPGPTFNQGLVDFYKAGALLRGAAEEEEDEEL